jgi:cellulose synthase (UDP-forming)
MQETPFTFSASATRNRGPRLTRTPTPPPRAVSVGFLIPILAFAFLAYLSSANTSVYIQIVLSIGLMGLLFFVKFFRDYPLARVIFLTLSTFIILRYLFWRTLYTVEFTDWVSFSCSIILFMAELYGILVALIGNFVNLSPLERTPPPLPLADALPTVDVMIPSYNEAIDLVETTLIGAIQMDYPEDKKKVYLLDDGGTDQKCQKGSEASTRAARERRAKLQALCAELGVTYLTRPQNRFAKAGNINEAIQKTNGELIVILDSDHVPTTDFLEKTVGFFQEDPKLFLVQTPHFFVNPDPIERNLDTFQRMPGEASIFGTRPFSAVPGLS